jgi:hypothetical protein
MAKTNNALTNNNPRKTFHTRSPSPSVESEGGDSIRIPTINAKFQKGVNNQELMV